MGAGNEIAAQQRAQGVRVEPVGLDLRIGDEPRLERMGQNDLFDLLDLFEKIVGEPPVPAGFEHRLARPSEGFEELNQAVRGVPVNAGFPQRPAPFVLCAEHTVLLVSRAERDRLRAEPQPAGWRRLPPSMSMPT